ncbi:MAG: DUF1302 domain-containing protein [Alphaproteobacteria bacterium]|nr:DUF1302 domain-containing protein [Alphaproteobacteria bacterium]
MSLSNHLRGLLLAGASAVGMAVATGPAAAIEFEIGDIEVSIATTISTGMTMRVEDPACKYTSIGNGGCLNNGYSYSVESDDANVNYGKFDVTSQLTKFTSDFEVKYDNIGVFVRAKGYYDYWATQRSDSLPRPIGGHEGDAEDLVEEGIDVLDYFVYGSFELGEMPLNVRLGNQVVNWGESLFFQGGINSYLPVDVNALRAPGAELKEGLLPQPTAYASLGLTESLTLEAYYVYDFTQTQLDACSTLFASADSTLFTGCQGFYSSLGDRASAPLVEFIGDPVSPDHGGQWGAALRYYADWLNDGTELGLYFTNQTIKTPLFSYTSGSIVEARAGLNALLGGPVLGASADTIGEFCDTILTVLGQPTGFSSCLTTNVAPGTSVFQAAFGTFAGTIETFNQYPEDVQSVGFSWATTLWGSAFSGEFNYTFDMPFQKQTAEFSAANAERLRVGQYACDRDLNGIEDFAGCTFDMSTVLATEGVAGDDQYLQGYGEDDVLVGQISTITLIQEVADVIGSNSFTLITNWGFQWLPNMDEDARYNSAVAAYNHPNVWVDTFVTANSGPGKSCVSAFVAPVVAVPTLYASGACVNDAAEYADDLSYGYRIVMTADFNNAFGTGVNVTPTLQWRHDVDGFSAGQTGPGFVDNLQSIGVGVAFNYLQAWRASVNYTTSFGNSFANANEDKDYVTVDLSYSF